ncbi:MAG: tyrosine-type recombinase/integrase [Sedimentisphaerales bacterium]|jgi:integrase
MTVRELFSQYLICNQLAETSKDIKQRVCNYFIGLFGKDITAGRVDYAMAEDFRNWLANRSRRAVNTYIRNFRPFWEWLVKRRIIEANPFELIKDVQIENYVGAIFGPSEIERMFRMANMHWQIYILLGMVGLRRGEVLNLMKNDIDYAGQCIHIRGKKGGKDAWPWQIKNHQQRDVPLPETIQLPDIIVPVHRILKELAQDLPMNQPYISVRPKDYVTLIKLHLDGKLTYGRRNCPYDNFARDFRQLQRRSGVKPIRPFRDMRATFATAMSNTMQLTDTQKLMGHKSPQTTAIYYIRRDGRLRIKAANQIVANGYAYETV